MRSTAIRTISFLALILFAATAVLAQRDGLAETRWNLIEVNGRRVVGSIAFIELNSNLTRFTGSTGCNNMFGRVSVRASRIKFSGIGRTRRYCKMIAGSVPEAEFIRTLDKAARYEQSGRQLRLTDRRGRTLLRFRADEHATPEPDPDGDPGRVDLEDRRWMLETIGTRMTPVAVQGVFINFGERQNSAGGNTGCNVFGGSYTKSGTSLAIRDIISTMRACEEDNKMQVERDFLDGLRRTNRYEIRQGMLYLYRNQELLLTFRGERK